ncbi:MAG: hypothetical protein Q3M30_04765 [Candidatus Electrothrix sp. Rat3]|nr:hypothetical protein [Candidatus Electrothrix rattekaaiensis]
MKLFIISVLSVCLLTCSGCDNPLQPSEKKQESKDTQGTALIHISPKIIKGDTDQDCNNPEFYNQLHYYELYIDRKLVYRNRLRTINEEDVSTKWQLPLGEHQLRVFADGFESYENPIEVVKKTQASTVQRFEMVLRRNEQAKDKKTTSP